jgi:hypothetical protein
MCSCNYTRAIDVGVQYLCDKATGKYNHICVISERGKCNVYFCHNDFSL